MTVSMQDKKGKVYTKGIDVSSGDSMVPARK
jgi:hypothetical protein